MTIQESLHRILEQRDTLADLFYLVFLERYPEVRHHFEGVNFRRQNILLTMALLVVERNYSGTYPATEMYLKYLGTKHQGWNIPEDSYAKFRDALLATLERFHNNDWDANLAGQWREAIERAAAAMLVGYREPITV